MDPILTSKFLDVPFAGTGTTLERNALIGVIRNLIKDNKYTVDYILDYCASAGYSYKMASDVFTELTGLSPKLIVNNNEYYKMPSYVPNMCIAWGEAKTKKDVAYYIVPGAYGYVVMEKDEVNSPVPTVEVATIPEAIDELKKVAKKIQTLHKIITEKLLETENVQTSADDTYLVNKPYCSDPAFVLKKNFKDKVIGIKEFEKQARQLVAEDKISIEKAEDLMSWKDDLIDEDESYNNEVLEHTEKWNQLKADEDEEDYFDSFDYIYNLLLDGDIQAYKARLDDFTEEELIDYLEWASEHDIDKKDLELELSDKRKPSISEYTEIAKNMKEEGKTRTQINNYLQGKIQNEEIKRILDSIYNKKQSSKKVTAEDEFEKAFENDLIIDDENDIAWFPGYEEHKFEIEPSYEKMKEKALKIWKQIHSSKKQAVSENIEDDKTTYVDSDLVQYHIEKFPSGKWYYWFNNPVSKRREQVGPYSTEQEAREFLKKHHSDVDSNHVNEKAFKDLLNWESKKISSSKKVTAEEADLDDLMSEESKDEVQEEMEQIKDTPVSELLSEQTPADYFDKSLQEDKVDTINDVVSKCIDKFSEKFKDFEKYEVKILSYNTKVLGDYTPNKTEMIEDEQINANAVLQVILQITNNADETEMKKALAVFSVTNGKLHWTGTIRGENDEVVAFTEEGLDSLFEVEEIKEEELEDII